MRIRSRDDPTRPRDQRKKHTLIVGRTSIVLRTSTDASRPPSTTVASRPSSRSRRRLMARTWKCFSSCRFFLPAPHVRACAFERPGGSDQPQRQDCVNIKTTTGSGLPLPAPPTAMATLETRAPIVGGCKATASTRSVGSSSHRRANPTAHSSSPASTPMVDGGCWLLQGD